MGRARSGVWVVLGGVLGALAVAWFLWLRTDTAPADDAWLPAVDAPPASIDAPRTAPPVPQTEKPIEGPGLMTAPPMPRFPARLEAAWARALALHEDYQSAKALQLLLPFLKDYSAFFQQPSHAPTLAAIRAAVVELLKEKSPEQVLRELVQALLRGEPMPKFPGDGTEARLLRKIAASAQVVARLPKPAEREQMVRHLERFLIAGARPARPGAGGKTKSAGADDLLQQVQARLKERGAPVAPLPVAAPEEAEARRLAQLENLHARDVVGLLDTIHTGLLWLVLHQGEDGRFSDGAVAERIDPGRKPTREEKKEWKQARRELRNGERHAVASTALGVIALLDFRDQDATGLFEQALARAVGWLLKQQARDGSFNGRRYYTDAIALMALGQAAASSGSEPIRLAVERGLARLHEGTGPGGGYRYGRGQPGDVSVAGWVAQAIEMARLAKAKIPDEMEQDLEGFLRLVWEEGPRFSYMADRERYGFRTSLFPVGMLMGRILWKEIEDDVLASWRAYLQKPEGHGRPDLYTLYYGVRMGLLLEDKLADPWRTWTQEVADKQRKEGLLAGSFPGELSGWMGRAGVTVVSTTALLTLEHALYLR